MSKRTWRVDAHHHLWQVSRRRHDWLNGEATAPIRRDFGPDDLALAAADGNIDATVLVQVLPDFHETVEFLAMAGQTPLIAGVVGWVDLTSSTVDEDIAKLRAVPGGELLAGIRHLVQSEPDPRWLVREDVLRGLRAVRDAGLVYDLLVTQHQLPAAIAAVRALPDLVFVLDHLGKPPIRSGEFEPWATLLAELAAEPNTVAKVSGLVTEADWQRWILSDLAPYVETALCAFGPQRLMVGSDWPVCLLATHYETVFSAADLLFAGLTSTERAQLFGATATGVYGLAIPR